MIHVALLALLGLLFVGSAFLALAEVSLLRVQPVMLEERDRRVKALLEDLPVVLNTVLLVVLFAQVSAAAVSGYLAQRWFGGVAVTVVAVLVTIVLFVYAEVIPKTMALRSPVRWARLVARPVTLMVRVLRPATSALLTVADAHMSQGEITSRTGFTERELRLLMVEAARAGEIEAEDAHLVERSFDFGDLRVADVFVPRRRVVAVEVASTVDDALRVAIEHGHRRLPVCEGGLDHVVGIVRLRDLAEAAAASDPSPGLAALATPPMWVSRREPLASVLRKMQGSGRRFALVTGAEGGVDGIVTIEDVVAELVGEIEEDD